MASAKSIVETVGKEMLMPFISDIIAIGLLGKKGGGNKIIENSEQARELILKIAPHLFGLGLTDEALFNSALAKLEDGRQKEINRFLSSLDEPDQARFMLAITILPEEKDRIEILNMYSEMETVEEMTELAKATHFITKGENQIGRLSLKAKAAAIAIAAKMTTIFLPILKDIDIWLRDKAAPAVADWSGSKSRPSKSNLVNLAHLLFR
ncbi:MAG: hypothetical protein AAB730_01450 [Patescibacteria group bacterium]